MKTTPDAGISTVYPSFRHRASEKTHTCISTEPHCSARCCNAICCRLSPTGCALPFYRRDKDGCLIYNSPNNLPRPVRPPRQARIGLESAPTGKPLPLIRLNASPARASSPSPERCRSCCAAAWRTTTCSSTRATRCCATRSPDTRTSGAASAEPSSRPWPGTPRRTPPPTSSPTNSFEMATKVYGLTRRTLRRQCCASLE